MCSIIGSFNLDSFLKLLKYNQSRGNFSYSLTVLELFENNCTVSQTYKSFGEFDESLLTKIKIPQHPYFIGHVQAPTGGLIKDFNRIHPSVNEQENPHTYLWHNGILKDPTIQVIKDRYQLYDNEWNWDTKLLHKSLDEESVEILSELEGSFGCIWIVEPKLYLFTNDLVNLYIDDKLNISSLPFQGSNKIYPNVVFQMNFINSKIEEIHNFKTKNTPYYFSDNEEE